MIAFRNDRGFYKKRIDDIFDSYEKEFDYITMKKFFEDKK